MSHERILVVDDDRTFLRAMCRVLSQLGYHPETASSGEDAIARIEEVDPDFDLVLTDMRMPGAGGFEVLDHVRQTCPGTPVVMLTGVGTIENAVKAMQQGAFDYLTKPPDQQLPAVVERALSTRYDGRPATSAQASPEEQGGDTPESWRTRFAFETVGQAPALLEALEIAAQAAGCDCPALITGESGTGKELLARALHRASPRKEAPFVAVNCPAIPRELVESELFGHAKGAFTGATTSRMGRFEAADTGTLFLDEIGEMAAGVQSKLLRVLQDYCVTRVGESRSHKVDVRVIAATNRDLEKMADSGEFRGDLFYCLNVIEIHLPPLRERGEDIDLLVDHFLAAISDKHKTRRPTLTPAAREILKSYHWPGNIRELRNVIERLVILRRGREAGPAHLPVAMRASSRHSASDPEIELPPDGVDLKRVLQEVEDRLIRQAGSGYIRPRTFLGIAGMRVFRDEVWGGLRIVFRADHKAYKRLGVYDFPQRKIGHQILVRLGWLITGLPGIRRRFPEMIKQQMVRPYRRVLEKI